MSFDFRFENFQALSERGSGLEEKNLDTKPSFDNFFSFHFLRLQNRRVNSKVLLGHICLLLKKKSGIRHIIPPPSFDLLIGRSVECVGIRYIQR